MISKNSDFSVPFKIIQFPILGVYYLSFNISQVFLLTKAGLYIPRSVFYHGHLYVEFSRCGDLDEVHIYADQKEFVNICQHLSEGKYYTRKHVYQESFSSD